MDIERLITWALVDQGLMWSFGKSRDLDMAMLGTRVDISPRGSVAFPSMELQDDDDAMIVKRAIEQLPMEAQAVVLRYGRAQSRPDWCEEGVGHKVPRLSGGRQVYRYADPGNRRGPREPLFDWEGWRQSDVDAFRAEYRLWWYALKELVGMLDGKMVNHEVTGPKAPLEPWNEAKPVIHRVG